MNTVARTKKRYSKTKAGCRTCKVRKVRCDEMPPTCLNCQKANRRCTGVNAVSAPSGLLEFAAPLTPTRFPTTGRWLSSFEAQYLDMFRRGLVNGIATGSWKRLILQVVADEPTLCHAVVAFSAVNRGEMESGQEHHAKALQGITNVFGRQEQKSINVALVFALLSICYDLRRREPAFALMHLEYALQIVQSNLAKLDEDVVLAFMRLDLQAAVFLGWRAPAIDVDIVKSTMFLLSTPFKSTQFSLLCLMNHVMRFIRLISDDYRYGQTDEAQEGAALERQTLLDQMLEMELALEQKDFSKEQNALLRIQWASTYVMLIGSLFRDETVYEACEKQFTDILTAAEIIMATQNREFGIDMVVISPLYLTTMKCRKPDIRHKAIDLLKITSHEGAWEGQVNYKIGQVVSKIEANGTLVHSVSIYLEPKAKKASLHIKTFDNGWRFSREEISWEG